MNDEVLIETLREQLYTEDLDHGIVEELLDRFQELRDEYNDIMRGYDE